MSGHNSQKKSLEDLEQIYAKNKNFHNKPDTNYDTLKISKDEIRSKSEPIRFNKEPESNYSINNRNIHPTPKKRDEFIEMKSFLPTTTEKMISTRYHNPLNQLRESTKRWRILTLTLGIVSVIYMTLNLLWSLDSVFCDTLAFLPDPVLYVYGFFHTMEDSLFLNDTLNLVVDSWGIVTYVSLFILVLKERKAHIQNNFEEKGRLEQTASTTFILGAVLFGIVYILGTLSILADVHGMTDFAGMMNLLVYHASKLVVLVINGVAFRKYKKTKYTYEDLMLEALGSSDSGEESGDTENTYE